VAFPTRRNGGNVRPPCAPELLFTLFPSFPSVVSFPISMTFFAPLRGALLPLPFPSTHSRGGARKERADSRLRDRRGETKRPVLVARDGKILFQGGYGYADLENAGDSKLSSALVR
jgi:CubicO group peptidase (beta-lactamase class C family)